MANVAIGFPYALSAIVVGQTNYNFQTDYWFSVLLVVTLNSLDFVLRACVAASWFVQQAWFGQQTWSDHLHPPQYPHTEDKDNLGDISRYHYFLCIERLLLFLVYPR